MDIQILLALQQFRDGVGSFLSDFMLKMTFLGETDTVVVIAAIIYWAVHKDLGTYLLFGWSGNRLLNGLIKLTACVYRPFIRDPRIIPLSNASGYSFPSGHAMNAASLFGGAALRRELPSPLHISAWILLALVSFSRLFVGVHTPQDVLVGAAVGLLLMWAVGRLLRWVEAHPGKDWLVVCIGLAVIAAASVYGAVKPYPVDYGANGKMLVNVAKLPTDIYKRAAWIAGILIGWILERRFVRFSTEVPVSRKLTRIAVGMLLYYAVTLIAGELLKDWISGPMGNVCASFLEMFYVVFLFPCCIRQMEKERTQS